MTSVTRLTAVYPGTFDPMTLGHEDLMRRAARLFERLIVAVAAGHHKRTMFTIAERLDIARAGLELSELECVDAVSSGLALAGYGQAFERLQAEPAAAMDVLARGGFGPVNAILRINTWATPLLLLAWIAAYWLRPRSVHLARRKR